MILETCKRGWHWNRVVMRVNRDRTGHKHTEEWHVCRACGYERKHRTARIVAETDEMRGHR